MFARTMVFIAVLSSTRSDVFAWSGFYPNVKFHSSALMPCQQTYHHRCSVSGHGGSSALQLKASADQGGGFFGDDSAGNFSTETDKPPSKAKEEETPMTLEELEMLATPFDEHLPKINMVNLVGRVGNDPEPRYFDDGKVVLNLSLAVRRKYHPLERKVREIRSGEEETDWFSLELWGRDAEYVANYVEKGTRLGITGSLAMDGWIDKTTGEPRRKPKIVVRHTDILESRAEAELRKSNRGSYDANGNGGAEAELRKSNQGSYAANGNDGGSSRTDEDDDGGPTPAGTGGFFN